MKIYTDGSCINNGKKNAIGGIGVFFGDNDIRNISRLQDGLTHSNQLGELQAIYNALEISEDDKNIEIFTDSNYSINCLTKWYKSWEKNNWKTTKGKDVIHKELLKNILLLIKKKQRVKFIHVRSHQPEPNDKQSNEYDVWYGNYKADELATNAIKNEKK